MNILGIDLSSNTGFVALSDDPSFFFAHELTTTAKGMVRLAWFRSSLSKLIKTYPPTLVVLEGYSFSGKFTNSFQYEIGTVIRMALYDAGLTFIEIPPTTLKSAICTSGKATKEQMMLSVYKRWGFDPATNNIADAYGLAKIGQAILGVETGLTKANLASVFKVQSVKDYVSSSKA